MPMSVSVSEAKANWAALLARVAQGEDVVITRNGQPVARLVAEARPPRRGRVLGTARGQVDLLPGWDDPMSEDELRDWYDPPEPGAES